ncbi:MAG: universal stress protein [Kofleriaceae bacterium]
MKDPAAMKKILVGVDLSEASEVAIAHAVAMGRHTGAEVVLALATWVPEPPVDYERSLWPTYEAYAEQARRGLATEHAQLTALAARYEGQGARISKSIADGRADDVLPSLAEELDADLLVVGTHGRTGLSRALLGSVAERVVRTAHTSVYVARGPAPAAGFKRVVVGTDFEPLARTALRAGAAFAADDGQLDLVSCLRMVPVVPMGEIGATFDPALLRSEIEADLGARGAAALAEIARPGLRTSFAVVDEVPKWGVVEHAKAVAADLVVVGSHGRRGLRRWILGSVAEATVRHAECSVLVARAAT